MKSFIEQAQYYSQYHQKKITFYTHLAGIPLLMFSFMIFLGCFKLIVPGVINTTLASIGTLVLFVYYLRLNWLIALLLAPVLVFLLWIASVVSDSGPTSFALWMFIASFIIGVALQLAGHLIERRKPAFMDNALQAVIAPMFLTAELCFMLGRMPNLKTQIHNKDTVPDPVIHQ